MKKVKRILDIIGNLIAEFLGSLSHYAIVFCIIIGAFASCRNTNKSISSSSSNTNITATHTSDSSNTNVNNVTNERNNSSSVSSSSSGNSTSDVELYFDESNAYIDSTTGRKTTSTGELHPIKIGRDSNGNTTIDPGGRKLKSFKSKTSVSNNQVIETKSDSSSKFHIKDSSANATKKADSLHLNKEDKSANSNKKTSSFNWFNLWWLLPIIAYFISRYLYKKNMLPVNPLVAKYLYPI